MNAQNAATDILDFLGGLGKNPYVVGAAALIVAVGLYFVIKLLLPWFQKLQDFFNTAQVTQATQKVDQDTQTLQHQVDDLFNKDAKIPPVVKSLLVIALLSSLTACAHSEPLGNFRQIEPDFAAGAQPEGLGWAKLKQMGIRTIVKLNSEDVEEERDAARIFGFHLIEIPESGIFAPTEEQANQAQAAVWNPALRPVFVHCTHGADRTGEVIAIYRVEHNGWSQADAHAEWMKYGHSPWLELLGMDKFFREHTK